MVESASTFDRGKNAKRVEELTHPANDHDQITQDLLVQINDVGFQPAPEEIQLASIETLKSGILGRVQSHLLLLGYVFADDGTTRLGFLTKEQIRTVQREKKREQLLCQRTLLTRHADLLLTSLADGDDIVPSRIEPDLIEVRADTDDNTLFRLLTMYWSVPVSGGYGRRMRFLVKDLQNDKVIGLFGLTDPVFNLRVRDSWIGWNLEQKKRSLRCVLDAFVLGAVPPYSELLGGKLVCALTTASEVREVYKRKYGNMRSVILDRQHDTRLLLLTTTSALGQSSLYDRVKLDGRLYFVPAGQTEGYGHFHIPASTFSMMRELLVKTGHPYAKGNRFGNGPNWRMRVIRVALQYCGLSPEILKHQVSREAYMIPLARNSRECLLNPDATPDYYDEDTTTIARRAIRRWIVPRAARRSEYRRRRNWQILEDILKTMGPVNDSGGQGLPNSQDGCR